MKTKEKFITPAKDDTYNGWTNYETWNVALWIDNEQSSYNYWREIAKDALDRAVADQYSTKEQQASCGLAALLKDEITDNAPDMGASTYSDLLGAALSQVNWQEIAQNFIGEVSEVK